MWHRIGRHNSRCSNPLDVVKIFKLSRVSYNKMIQNLIWASGYNIVALPLAAGCAGLGRESFFPLQWARS
jgi:cation transport ATPase